MKKVFLGGTYDSSWRNQVIQDLSHAGLDYFNPIVDDWDEEAKKREREARKSCDFCLYTITPKMTGVYSIAEVVDDSNKRPEKTVLVLLYKDEEAEFTVGQWKSLMAVGYMVGMNGAQVFMYIKDAVEWMAKQ